jgi:Mg/Co/Ni transporter MgtE
VTCHPDDTLREIANRLAAGHVTQALVVDRGDPHRVRGVISLAQLLHARRRDLHEENHRERVLAVTRIAVTPASATSSRG